MASTTSGNVVALGDHPRAKSRLSPQESASVLSGCRDLALDKLTKALSTMLDRVEDELFTLAEGATDRDMQNVFLDARSHARARRTNIEATFRGHFAEFFNKKVRGESTRKSAAASSELSLVDSAELEESLALSDMARNLKTACEEELGALGQRMGFLLDRGELEDDANPLSPATVCAALSEACGQVEAGYKVRLVLLRQIERHAAIELQRMYHDVNAHLVARSILPEIRYYARKNAATKAPNAPGAQAAKQGGAPANAAGAPANPADLFGTLTQLMGAAGAVQGGMPGGGMGGGPAGAAQMGQALGGAAGGQPFGAPMSGGAPLMQALTRMHREAPGEGEVLVATVREFKASALAANLGTVDAMTIDIVAMLFDYVFEDRHIPDSVKALLGRLQIPVLKVALMDKSFFSSKSHPARQLIDSLADVSIGLEEHHERGAATLKLIEEIVESVLADFETDLALFEKLGERVRAFIAENEAADQAIVTRSASAIEAMEREESAREAGEREVERRLSGRLGVPAVVRAMLFGQWTKALTAAYLAGGEQSGPWKFLVGGMDDLLWSVEPKPAPEDRKRLVSMLPTLLRTLNDGFGRAGTPDSARGAFFAALVDCHAGAVKMGMRGMAPMPEVEIPPVPEAPRIEREVLPAGGVQVEQIRLKTSKGVVRNVFTRTGIWTNVQRGTWVEFARSTGAATRARLTWISPNKGVYLFTNPTAGAAAISISPEALAEQMRLGEARILEASPLVDRAVDSMLANLRNDPASAGGGARVA